MEKRCQSIYLYLCWHRTAFGFSPSWEQIAETCATTIERARYWVNKLAVRGYVKLYEFNDGSYEIKIMVDPLRRWKVNLIRTATGLDCQAEVPVSIFIWDGGVAPTRVESVPLPKPKEI